MFLSLVESVFLRISSSCFKLSVLLNISFFLKKERSKRKREREKKNRKREKREREKSKVLIRIRVKESTCILMIFSVAIGNAFCYKIKA